MKAPSIAYFLVLIILAISCAPKPEKNNEDETEFSVDFVNQESEKRIDVLVDDELFTSLKWPEGVYKPVLHPIKASTGTVITRGFPLDPKPGERPDHQHHVGNWLNYGNVNGFDFWGNGHSGERSENGGEIKMLEVELLKPGQGEGIIITSGSWVDNEDNELLEEKTEYHFIAKELIRIIDRITTLTATKDITMDDTKEGMFAVRVARQLELPAEGDITLLDAQGVATKVSAMSNEGITGDYLSSEGITGADVWGTRARWMKLFGNIEDEKVALVICDHPENQSYPTYWHARGYGLFSANPLGARDFTEGKEEINFSLASGQSVTFRYRLVVSSGDDLTTEEIEGLAKEFGQKY